MSKRRASILRSGSGRPLIREVDLHGCSSSREALEIVDQELRHCFKNSFRILKIIHGYGSTGKGGALRIAILGHLHERKRIKILIPGEHWHVCHEDAQLALNDYPTMRDDPDLSRDNLGMTLAFLR